MSNGDDVLDNWEEIDEAGIGMTLQTKLQTAKDDNSSSKLEHNLPADTAAVSKMKLLQRPQSLHGTSSNSNISTATLVAVVPKQIMIAQKPQQSAQSLDSDFKTAPVMMVLHKPNSDYDGVNYATPISNQTVKILRRPAQTEDRRDSNGMRPKQPIKTLQQREQEYAQARLRILGSAKNPEDDKPVTPPCASPVSVPISSAQAETPQAPHPLLPAANFNNNNSGTVTTAPGMHRSNSAPKMSQTAPIYNNYNNYYQTSAPNPAAMGYYYTQQTPSMHQQQVQQQQTPPHYNQRMSPFITGAPAVVPQTTINPPQQQSWSPVVGGSVSAALLRQQSLHSPSLQQQQLPTLPPYAHPYNENVLRLPRGPCPNGTVGFQMRR